MPDEIVPDANLMLNAVISRHPYHRQAKELLSDCAASGVALIAPSWWEVEADSNLRRMEAANYLTSQAMAIAQAQLDNAPITIVYEPAARVLARQIADSLHPAANRVHDATYGALALLRDCPFWTADERFYNAVQQSIQAARNRRKVLAMPDVRLLKSYAGEYAPLPQSTP